MWSVPRPSTFPLYDRIIGGGLWNLLCEWRDNGDSYEDISYRLRTKYDIQVTASTVYRWMLDEVVS